MKWDELPGPLLETIKQPFNLLLHSSPRFTSPLREAIERKMQFIIYAEWYQYHSKSPNPSEIKEKKNITKLWRAKPESFNSSEQTKLFWKNGEYSSKW